MSGDQVQVGPVLAIPLYVPAAQNRSNDLFRSLALCGISAPSQNLRPFILVNDKRFVTSCEDSTIYIHAPFLQRCTYGLDLVLDTLFDV